MMDQHASLVNADLPLMLEIEQPESGVRLVPGYDFSAFGWVLGPEAISSITVYLDDAKLGSATLGIPRPDIAAAFPYYADNASAGFWFSVRLAADRPVGPAQLRFVAATRSHRTSRDIDVTIGQKLGAAPVEAAPEPIRLEIEEVSLDANAMLKVMGWAASTEPLRSVELFIGEQSIGTAVVNVSRPDVAAVVPHYDNASSSGFVFEAQLDPSDAESRELLILASDSAGRTRSTQSVVRRTGTMRLFCDDSLLSEDGALSCVGWAVCESGVVSIGIEIDDIPLGQAETGISRPDVGKSFQHLQHAENAGFRFTAKLNGSWKGEHGIRITARGAAGETRSILQTVASLPSLGVPEEMAGRPPDETTHFFCDEIDLAEDGTFSGAGWAVCPSGVKSIVVQIGDHPAIEAEIGISRPDVAKRFPAVPAAGRAGFRFSCMLGGVWQGDHVAMLLAITGDGDEHSILQPVGAKPIGSSRVTEKRGASPSEHIKFYLDLPEVEGGQAKEPTRGFTLLSGWAFARTGILKIEVFVDGHLQGHAFTGIRREDIQSVFPGWDALLSGFAMLLPPQALKPGSHEVRLVVHDTSGHTAQTAFRIDAEEALEGPGPWQLRRKMKQAETDLLTHLITASASRPQWTLVVLMRSMAQADRALLRSTIESISEQGYADWRVIVHVPRSDSTPPDPGAGSVWGAETLALWGLETVARQVSFIPVDPRTTLADLVGADGMVILLEAGDCLGEDALLEFSVEAGLQPEADFFYGDERRIDPTDGREKPFFKPAWSPDLLLSMNYIGRIWAAKASLLQRSALTLGEFCDHGDYDAVLRLTELARSIHHVGKILVTRRTEDPADHEGGKAALRQAASRRGLDADVQPGRVPGSWRMTYAVTQLVDSGALVSIIIPSIASRGLVKVAVESIRRLTRWPNYEIILIDNIRQTTDPGLLGWKAWMRENADRVIELDQDFNWSLFNNIGAANARGDFLLFLNDDIEVLDGDWLHGLLGLAQLPEVGVVGPQLLYPDGRVQHAGMFLSGRVGRHAFRFYPSDAPGSFGLALTQRNVISVTGACMMTRRSAFEAVGGFDEAHSVINNDLDFSLRLQRAGFRVVYTPHVTLTHHEMVSRSALKDDYNSAHFDAEWSDTILRGDPYFHPLLAPDCDDYLTEPEPLRVFQAGHPLIAAERVRRILAVKVDHIGDFIAALPAFRRIKQHFPNAELCVLAARASLALAAMEPAIDRVIEFNFFHARSSEGELDLQTEALLELQRILAPLRFDIALDLRRQADTRKILRYTGARWLGGFDRNYACSWLDISMEFEGDVARNFKRSHVTDSLLQFIDVVGTACSTDRDIIHHVAPTAEEAVRSLSKHPAVKPIARKLFLRPVVCIHAGAGAENKQWPARSFAGLIDLLAGQESLNVLIVGGPDEVDFTASVLADIRHRQHVFSVVGKTTLADLPTVLLACRLFVGNDSGPKHMAAALGVPTIGIHSGSVDAGEWGPIGPFTMTLRRDMTCGPCYIAHASDCPRSLACLTGIRVGDVFRACQRMLALRRMPAPSGSARPRGNSRTRTKVVRSTEGVPPAR
jgi:ADP-heptose:LPS heptosyltransferase/GT2 family glycosyltransferase